MGGCCTRGFNLRLIGIYLPILLTIFYLLDKHVLSGLYIFEPAKLQELSRKSIDLYGGENGNATLLFEDLTLRLQKEYGAKHVADLDHSEWVFNNAGGAMVSRLWPWPCMRLEKVGLGAD